MNTKQNRFSAKHDGVNLLAAQAFEPAGSRRPFLHGRAGSPLPAVTISAHRVTRPATGNNEARNRNVCPTSGKTKWSIVNFPTCRFFQRAISGWLILGLALCVQAQNTNLDLPALQKLADKGDAKSQYELAVRYQKGEGISRDDARAFELMRQSAEQGYAPAEGQLGYYYGVGLGVAQNPEEALKWYRKSAEQGNAVAQYGLGYIYSTGKGVPKDMDQAVQWWRKAAEQNLAQAQYALGHYYFHQPATNAAAGTNAIFWLRKAAGQGYAPAQNDLGVAYEYGGHSVQIDWKEAEKWYHQAAENDDAQAQGNLGRAYFDGRGVSSDFVQAYAWFVLAAEKGDANGKRFVLEFQTNQLLDTNQLAEAKQLVVDFRKRHAGSPKP